MWEWRLARLDGEAFYKRVDTFEHLLDNEAHLLIEEAMIATNFNTALYLRDWVIMTGTLLEKFSYSAWLFSIGFEGISNPNENARYAF